MNKLLADKASVYVNAHSQLCELYHDVLNGFTTTPFWQQHAQAVLCERKVTVLNCLLNTDGEECRVGPYIRSLRKADRFKLELP